jgi:DUF4097 and DUF4098 domain-containing protein YvlB
LLDEARIDLRESPRGHEVVVHVGARRRIGFGFWRKVDVRLTIRTPQGASLQAHTASADLRGRGPIGSLEAKTASGDVELDRLVGDATVETASGDVRIRDVGGKVDVSAASGDVELGRAGGAVAARTASGDVTVEEAAGDVRIRTASGDGRVDSVSAGSVDLQSASGDILVGIREGSNVFVDARALSGDLTSEVELDDAPPTAGDAPLVELRASSMRGDIAVVRAPAAAELNR